MRDAITASAEWEGDGRWLCDYRSSSVNSKVGEGVDACSLWAGPSWYKGFCNGHAVSGHEHKKGRPHVPAHATAVHAAIQTPPLAPLFTCSQGTRASHSEHGRTFSSTLTDDREAKASYPICHYYITDKFAHHSASHSFSVTRNRCARPLAIECSVVRACACVVGLRGSALIGASRALVPSPLGKRSGIEPPSLRCTPDCRACYL